MRRIKKPILLLIMLAVLLAVSLSGFGTQFGFRNVLSVSPRDGEDGVMNDGYVRPIPDADGLGYDSWNSSDDRWINRTQLVVGVKDEHQAYSSYAEWFAGLGGKIVDTVSVGKESLAFIVNLPSDGEASFFAERVKAENFVRYVEPVMTVKASLVPNDPYWSQQWAPRVIEADYSWNITIGGPSVLVAVLDTGVRYGNPDLAANYVPLGWDWVHNDSSPQDDHGHGTHVAGIIAAVSNNSYGMAGLAQVRIMAEKMLNYQGSGTDVNAAKAIIHATDQGADIISMSWGGGDSRVLHDSLKYAYDRGVLLVAAAGNDAWSQKLYPAAYSEVVAVTATDSLDNPASFTNYGDWVELAAPGVNILSLGYYQPFESHSGTSMAAPHVSGVAALIMSKFSNVTSEWVRIQLRYSADDLGVSGFDAYYGYGRVNARRAVEQLPPEHDIVISIVHRPPYVVPGTQGLFNATVVNFGTQDEANITVELFMNGSLVDSAEIEPFSSGSFTTLSLRWNPTVRGKYNATLYAPPIPDEMNMKSNVLTFWVWARSFILVPDDFPTIQAAINDASHGETIRIMPGTYHEHVTVNKTVALIGEDRDTTIVDGGGGGEVLNLAWGHINITGLTIRNGEYGITTHFVPFEVPSSWYDTIQNNVISDNIYGIYLYYAGRNRIIGNVVVNNTQGIRLVFSPYNTMRNNTLVNNVYNFGIRGYYEYGYSQDIDTSNTVNGKPIYYLSNQNDLVIDPVSFPSIGYLGIFNSKNVTIRGLKLENNVEGVLLALCDNSTITNVTVTDNLYGIVLEGSTFNTVERNIVYKNWAGIYLRERFYAHNTFSRNLLQNNTYALIFLDADMNYFVGNTVRANDHILWAGWMSGGGYNWFYHNNFIDNKAHLEGECIGFRWDNGSEGNYWSNYTGRDIYGKGIGYPPYLIDTWTYDSTVYEIFDNYPLMAPRVPIIPPYPLKGDINLDNLIDIYDLLITVAAFASTPADPNWNPHADLDNNDIIDILDLIYIGANFGKTAHIQP